ncbi:hypothetical protein B0H13DRAFT_1880914 [Mycena leptocephala]|nr:hypothetical protein B0H13DRAFT_1880914 [Mycena leptocephala]
MGYNFSGPETLGYTAGLRIFDFIMEFKSFQVDAFHVLKVLNLPGSPRQARSDQFGQPVDNPTLTADSAAYYTVILKEAQHLTARTYPGRFIVIPRPLCFYDGRERANWTYDTSDPGHFDYILRQLQRVYDRRPQQSHVHDRCLCNEAIDLRWTDGGREAEMGRGAHARLGRPSHSTSSVGARQSTRCNVGSVDYAASLQATVGGRAVQLARMVKAREGLQVWRNPLDEIPNTAGECYLRTFNWLQCILRSNPDTLATLADGELTSIRGFRKMLKPI